MGRSIAVVLFSDLVRSTELRGRVGEEHDFDDLPLDLTWLPTTATCAAVCTHLKDQPAAARLHDLLVPHADLIGANIVFSTGSVSHALGLLAPALGRFDEAEERFATAASARERIHAVTWSARTRLEWARTLLSCQHPGDAERGRELLHQALSTARELGLAKVESDAVALLQ